MGHAWWIFTVLILLPDVSMLGYLAHARVGAAAYNTVHTVLAPAILAGVGWGLGSSLIASLAAIWAAHIYLDRMLGYGLKYGTRFGDTHLSGPASRDITAGPA